MGELATMFLYAYKPISYKNKTGIEENDQNALCKRLRLNYLRFILPYKVQFVDIENRGG